ncbi:unnamed protein product [Cercospora beticola]|nr:unnamed protein product [Cercospora beticola]
MNVRWTSSRVVVAVWLSSALTPRFFFTSPSSDKAVQPEHEHLIPSQLYMRSIAQPLSNATMCSLSCSLPPNTCRSSGRRYSFQFLQGNAGKLRKSLDKSLRFH